MSMLCSHTGILQRRLAMSYDLKRLHVLLREFNPNMVKTNQSDMNIDLTKICLLINLFFVGVSKTDVIPLLSKK